MSVVLSSFLRTKLTFRGFSTSEIEKYLSEIAFFLGVSGIFLEEVVRIMSDVARCKVKIHLFYWDAFLTFRVTTQVNITPPSARPTTPVYFDASAEV